MEIRSFQGESVPFREKRRARKAAPERGLIVTKPLLNPALGFFSLIQNWGRRIWNQICKKLFARQTEYAVDFYSFFAAIQQADFRLWIA